MRFAAGVRPGRRCPCSSFGCTRPPNTIGGFVGSNIAQQRQLGLDGGNNVRGGGTNRVAVAACLRLQLGWDVTVFPRQMQVFNAAASGLPLLHRSGSRWSSELC